MEKMIIFKRTCFSIILLAAIAVSVIFIQKIVIEPPELPEKSHIEILIGYTELGRSLPVKELGDSHWMVWPNITWPKFLERTMVPYLHTMVIARDPTSGEEYYISAGRSNCEDSSVLERTFSSGSSSSIRCCGNQSQLCVVAEELTERSVDKISEIIYRQYVGRIETTMMNIRKTMEEVKENTNAARIDYKVNEENCNRFTSYYLKQTMEREVDPNLPDDKLPVLLPGWNSKLGLFDVIWK